MEEQHYEHWQNGHLEEAYRPPLWISLVFVLTMLAIYLMGRNVADRYPALEGVDDIVLLVEPSSGT